ncbi:MAG: tyrosine-type recombinase/integrase [bacterium]|nr:tyrosine-type recombinase/integrase [bacterium]
MPRTVVGLTAAYATENPHVSPDWLVQPWLRFAGDMTLDDVRPDTLQRFVRHLNKSTSRQERRKGTPLRPGTVRRYAYFAIKVMRWAREMDWISVEPKGPQLPKATRQPKDIEPAELPELFESLPDRARPLVRFILETGCRPSEAINLQWTNVRLARRVCEVPKHKSVRHGKTRTLYLTPTAVEILEQRERRSQHVFTNRRGKPYTAKGLGAILRGRGQTLYALRHTFAQILLERGVELPELKKLLGHQSITTTMQYIHVRDRRARAVAADQTSLVPKSPPDPPPAGADVSGAKPARPSRRRRKKPRSAGGSAA